MTRFYILSGLAVLVLYALIACAGERGTSQQVTSPGVSAPELVPAFTDLGLEFEPPSAMAAKITSLDDDWLKLGCDYESELPYANVNIVEASLRYDPRREGSPGQSSTAYAFYAFDIINHPVSTELKLIWHDYPGHLPCWVGLPVPETDEWEWIDLPADCKIPLEDISQFISAEMPLTVGVVLSGIEPHVLDYVRLGENAEPEATLTATPNAGECPLKVTLDASGSSDSDGNIVRYDWDFEGDGKVDSRSYTQDWTEFTYDTPGSYDATVTVYDDAGDYDSAIVIVTAKQAPNHAPVARISARPLLGKPPLNVLFDGTGSNDDDGQIVLYEWDFDDDGIVDFSSDDNPYAFYRFEDSVDNYTVLAVTDNEGAKDSVRTKISNYEWVHSWGTETTDRVFDSAVDANGDIYLCGRTGYRLYSYGSTLLLKYSATGDFLWARSWDDEEISADLRSVAVDSTGNIWVCGEKVIRGNTTFVEDILLQKYSPDGELLLSKLWCGNWGEFDGFSSDCVNDLLIDSYDNLYIVGSSFCYERNSNSLLLIKYNADGELQWSKLWGIDGDYEIGSSAILDESGAISIGGDIAYDNEPYNIHQAFLMRVDLDANIEWSKTYATHQLGMMTRGMAIAPNGDIAIVGGDGALYGRPCAHDAFIFRVNSSGNPVWTKIWDTASGDACLNCFFDPDGSLCATSAHSGGHLLLTISPSGSLECATRMLSYGYQIFESRLPNSLMLIGYSYDNSLPEWEAFDDDYSFESITPVIEDLDMQFRDVEGTEVPISGILRELTGVLDTGGGEDDAYILYLGNKY